MELGTGMFAAAAPWGGRATPDGARVPADAARRLYGLSRDIYAPVLWLFAERCLAHLRADRHATNLCVGRDGISAFLAQHVLLRLDPGRGAAIDPTRVRLVYLSRKLLADATTDGRRRLLDAYLRAHGLGRDGEVTVIDVGIHGVIQDTLQRLYPGQRLRGEYLILSRRGNESAAALKRGFLVERGAARTRDRVLSGARTDGGAAFLRRDTIHLLEDLWSGVFESVTMLRVGRLSGRARPVLRRLGTVSALPLPAAEAVRLKRAALRGVVDGVTLAAAGAGGVWHASDAAAQMAGEVPAVEHLARWVASTREPASPDAWLWRTLVRGSSSDGDGADPDSG